MRSFLELFGPSLREVVPLLQSVGREFAELTGSTKLRENSSVTQGSYDYVYDWHEKPTLQQIMDLINLLDQKLKLTTVYNYFRLL